MRGGGNANQPNASVSDCRRETNGVQHGTATDGYDIAAAIQICVIEALEHAFDDVDVVFDLFPTRQNLNIPRNPNLLTVLLAERLNAMLQFRIRIRDVFVHPELDSRNPAFRRFQQFKQRFRICGKQIAGKSQAMLELHRKRYSYVIVAGSGLVAAVILSCHQEFAYF